MNNRYKKINHLRPFNNHPNGDFLNRPDLISVGTANAGSSAIS